MRVMRTRAVSSSRRRNAIDAPSPLHAFFRRVQRRRGTQAALVAVARKLVVIVWHVLTSDGRYLFERATIAREKRRDLERKLGIPAVRKLPRRGEPSVAVRKEREFALQHEAEAAYQADIAHRVRKDAAAANGEATVPPSKGRDARRSLRPRRSALFTGSTASEEGGYAAGS